MHFLTIKAVRVKGGHQTEILISKRKKNFQRQLLLVGGSLGKMVNAGASGCASMAMGKNCILSRRAHTIVTEEEWRRPLTNCWELVLFNADGLGGREKKTGTKRRVFVPSMEEQGVSKKNRDSIFVSYTPRNLIFWLGFFKLSFLSFVLRLTFLCSFTPGARPRENYIPKRSSRTKKPRSTSPRTQRRRLVLVPDDQKQLIHPLGTTVTTHIHCFLRSSQRRRWHSQFSASCDDRSSLSSRGKPLFSVAHLKGS